MKTLIYKQFVRMSIIVTLLTSSTFALTFSTSVTNNYNFIYASGKIKKGDSYRLKKSYKVVDKRKQTIVVFDSGGGELKAGLNLGRYIKTHHIGTAVNQNGICASSCALSFLGGRSLYGKKLMILPNNSKLGFHSYYYKNPNRVSKRIMKKDFNSVVNYFKYTSASSSLLSKMLKTGRSDMYWITQNNNKYLTHLKKGLNNKLYSYNKLNTLSGRKQIKNYFTHINNIIKSTRKYRNKKYIALNFNKYDNWISRNLKYAYAKNIRVLKNNYIKVKVYYKLNNNVKLCTNNIYKLSNSRGMWKITYKKIRPCNKRSKRLSKKILNKLP